MRVLQVLQQADHCNSIPAPHFSDPSTARTPSHNPRTRHTLYPNQPSSPCLHNILETLEASVHLVLARKRRFVPDRRSPPTTLIAIGKPATTIPKKTQSASNPSFNKRKHTKGTILARPLFRGKDTKGRTGGGGSYLYSKHVHCQCRCRSMVSEAIFPSLQNPQKKSEKNSIAYARERGNSEKGEGETYGKLTHCALSLSECFETCSAVPHEKNGFL